MGRVIGEMTVSLDGYATGENVDASHKPEDEFTIAAAEAVVWVGGRFRVLMVSPEGEEHEASGVYLEVIP